MTTFVTVLGILVVLAIALIFLARYVGHLAEPGEVPASDPLLQKRKAELLAPVGEVVVAEAPAGQAAPAARPAAAGDAAGGAPDGRVVYQATCFACHGTGAAGAPKVGDKAAWEPRVAQGLDALVANAVKGKGAMPPKGGNMALGEAEIRAAVLHMLAETGLKAGDGTAPAPAQKPAAAAPASAPAAPATAEGADLAAGGRIYQSACFACHGTGAAGAPKVGDKAAWKDRIAQGMDTLVANAVKGKGAMPPKGGRMDLDEQAIRNAVAYMVSRSR